MRGGFLVGLFAAFLCHSAVGIDLKQFTVDDFSCGEQSCYDVLYVTSSANNEELKRSYRNLAREWHPDKNKSADSPRMFKLIAKAYDILSNEEKRKLYDMFLSHPQRFRAMFEGVEMVYKPHTHPLLVIILFFLLGHLIQYIVARWKYDATIRAVKDSETFKQAVQDEISNRFPGKKINKLSVEEREAVAVEAEIKVLEEDVEFDGQRPRPFTYTDFMVFQMVHWPKALWSFVEFHLRWFVKYSVKKEAYDTEAQEYITMQELDIPSNVWRALPDDERAAKMQLRLWDEKQLASWKEGQDLKKRKVEMKQSKRRGRGVADVGAMFDD